MSQLLASKSSIVNLSQSKKHHIEVSTSKRASYTNAFKRMALIHFDMTKSKSKTAINLKLSRQCIIDWVKKREQIFDPSQKLKYRRVVVKETQKQAFFKNNEERVHQWFLDLRNENIKVFIIELSFL
jgi:hypothetical protein